MFINIYSKISKISKISKMVDFAEFKKNRKNTDLSAIANAHQNKKSYADNRYWKLTTPDKKDGATSGAIIRFLPSPHDAEEPIIKYYSFSFKGVTGQYYIEPSLESIGQPDPVQDYNTRLWRTGDVNKQEDCKVNRPRKVHFISNILVVKDPANPSNEGKVFLYQFGSKIYEKITAHLVGDEVAGEESVDIFDFDEGANFSLSMTYGGKSGFFSYDKSKFLRQSSIGSEQEQEMIFSNLYDLQKDEPIRYSSYAELSSKFDAVMGFGSTQTTATDDGADGDNGYTAPLESTKQSPLVAPAQTKAKVKIALPSDDSSDDFSDFDSLIDDIPF
jgi:gp32 DNA binding protein like